MRKTKVIVGVLVMLLTCMLTVSAFADAPALTAAFSSASGNAGETVMVALRLDSADGISVMGYTQMSYDHDALKLESGDWTGDWTSATITKTDLSKKGAEKANFVLSDNVSFSGDVLLLRFHIADDAKAGKYEITANLSAKYSKAEGGLVDVNTTVTPGSITVNKNAECAHVWNDGEIVTDATCMEQGVMMYTCTLCGETRTEPIAAKGHKSEAIPGKAATCTEAGLTDGEKCSVCGEILKAQETIPALGHDWEDDFTVDKEPIEAIPGEKSIHCKRCDARKDITEIPGPGGLPKPMTRTDLMQDAMDRFFRDLYGRESYAWQQNGTSWTSSPVSFEEDITGVYHAEFADTDGDGEDELIAFAIVEVVDDAGNSIYQLVAEGWDVTEDGTVLHDEFIPDHCDTSSLITDPQISPSCWAAVRDQGIAFVHCNTSYDLTDLTFVTNHFCTYTSFANGKFGERTSLEFMLITEEEENLAVSVNGELKFIELTDSDTLADKIAAIRESLADDLLFPVNEEGQSIDTRIEQDVELEIDNDEMFLEVSDCTPALLMDMQEVVPFNLQDAAQTIRVPVTVYDHDGADKILIGFDSDGIKLVSVENADAYENMKVWVSEDGDRYYEFSDPTDWGGDYQTLCYATLKLNRTDFEQSPPGAAFFFASYEYDGEERVDEAGETSPWYFFEVISEPVQSGLRGDANLDGKVLANDARLVLRASAKLETLEGQAFINCDLNGDGKLLAGEARKILRYSAKLESEL